MKALRIVRLYVAIVLSIYSSLVRSESLIDPTRSLEVPKVVAPTSRS